MIIGISGHKQSGKNRIADFISYLYYYKSQGFTTSYIDFQRIFETEEFNYILSEYNVSFADPLKEIVCILTGCDREDLEKESFKNSTVPVTIVTGMTFTYRTLLQFLGTNVFRNYVDPDIWVNLTKNKMKERLFCVVPDVRFDNEAEAILGNDGCLIRVERPSLTNIDQHVSESILDDYNDFDITIINDGNLEDLYNKVDQFIKNNNIF